MTVYQLPSPPTQQPISELPYKDMAKPTTAINSQISTPKESMIDNLPGVTTVTTNGQPAKTNTTTSGNNTKAVSKKKSGLLYNNNNSSSLKIDTSVANSKGNPVSPTSQSPQPTSATTNHSPRPKTSSNNTFVHKLYQMLSDPKQSNFIKWNDTGLSFTIRNVQGFSRNVLPLHFRHNNFSSFVRQLNMYGFHKVNKSSPSSKNNENQVWEFFHPKFIRGKPHLIEEIKRKQIENESIRTNLLIEQSRVLARHNSFYENKSNPNKRNSTLVNGTTGVAVSAQVIPSQGNPMVNSQITNTNEIPGQAPVFMQGTEAIPATNVAVAVTSSGETVIIDPASLHNTPTLSVGLPNSQNIGNYGVIQLPSQNVPYNEVTATPVTGTPVPQAMTVGNVIPPTAQAMVDPANVVVSGHPIMPSEIPSVPNVNSAAATAAPPVDNDVLYNIQLLQMQHHDMNQRINDLQMNVNNLVSTYTRRMDMQQNLIQQLMNSTQQSQTPMGNVNVTNVTTVCSVDQGQTIAMMPQGANPSMVSNTIVTQSPIQNHQIIQQSPIQTNQMVVQPPSAGPEQKLMNPSVKQESIETFPQMNNPQANSVGYPTQTIYY